MTFRGFATQMMDIDCTRTYPGLAGYFPNYSTQANDSSFLMATNLSPNRRQSQRLKAINAIYQAEDAMSSQYEQPSTDNSPCPATHIKVESITVSDDHNETLKDLLIRCKAKKRKARKSVDFTTDMNHTLVKPKIEEPDLEEPLICLKMKRSSKSSRERKRGKYTHFSDSLSPVEQLINSQVCDLSIHGATDSSATTKELGADEQSHDITENACVNFEMSSNSDHIAACRRELFYTVKSEIVETNDAASSSSIFIENGNVSGNASTDQCLEDCEEDPLKPSSRSIHPKVTSNTELVCNNSSFTLSQTETEIVNDISLQFSEVGSGLTENVTCESKCTIYVSSYLNVDFIAKFSCPDNSSRSLHERNNKDGSEDGDSASVNVEDLDCRVNEISNDFTGIDSYTSSQVCGEGDFEEDKDTVSSESSPNKHSPPFSESTALKLYSDSLQLSSEHMDLSSDDVCERARSYANSLDEVMHDSGRNQTNYLATQESVCLNDGADYSMNLEFESQGDGMHLLEIPASIHRDKEAIADSFPSGDIHDLCHTSGFNEVGSLNSLVYKALAGDTWTNSNEEHSDVEKSLSVEKFDHCSSQLSTTCISSSRDLPTVKDGLTEPERLNSSTVEQMVTGYSEKAAENHGEELVEAIDCHTSQISPSCSSSALNGSFNEEDSLSKASRNVSSESVEKSQQTVNAPACSPEISNLVKGEGSCIEDEIGCDQDVKVENHPKKLLSNRKALSPVSQEKLRQALNSKLLDDTIKPANFGEAEAMLNAETTMKRSKSTRISSIQFLSKGILKSPDTSDKSSCSCSKNSLMQIQAEKAVSFCQRQMQDIENIATKLLKGLTCMKDIVEDSTGPTDSEACPSTSLKFTPEEIRTAINQASSLEATTKKWLSMMTKDCNRFSKIMRSTENKVAASAGVRKQPKKITFADEAGGLLCQVKVFEQLPKNEV